MNTIVLDAGHGQFGNPHTVTEGFFEGTQNFILAGYLRGELEALGYKVLLTRNDIADDPSLEERSSTAGKNGAEMFISIHSNAPPSSLSPDIYSSVRGVEVYYSLTAPEDERFAAHLSAVLAAQMGNPDRGAHTREYPDRPGVDYYGVIRGSVSSGCKHAFIVEHGFHTNPEDSALLENDGSLRDIAKAEAAAVDEYLRQL